MKPFDYKEINATELQKICAFINPPKMNTSAEVVSNCLLPRDKDTNPLPQRSKFPRMYPSRRDNVDYYIKKSGFEGYIMPKSPLNSPSGEPEIDGVDFVNLEIKEDVEIEFFALEKIEFRDSKFSGKVKITVKGAINAPPIIIFDNNIFSNHFTFTVVDARNVIIEDNLILYHKMDMRYKFTSLSPDDHINCKPKKTYSNIQHNELLLEFSKNGIKHLIIRDKSDSPDSHGRDHDYPLEKIIFSGNNYIKILEISTKHTVLNSYAKLKANVSNISFWTSDEIGISHPETDPNLDNKKYIAQQEDNQKLTYGRFFSLLEAQAPEQNDQVNEEMYKRKARYFKRKFSPRLEDRFIFGWSNLISKDGTSWFRPLLLLVITETSLAVIAYYFLGWDLNYSTEEGWRIFVTLFSWFMNPASLLPLPTLSGTVSNAITTISEAWLIYLLFLFQKFFAAVFYYEIIKTLRRFTK